MKAKAVPQVEDKVGRRKGCGGGTFFLQFFLGGAEWRLRLGQRLTRAERLRLGQRFFFFFFCIKVEDAQETGSNWGGSKNRRQVMVGVTTKLEPGCCWWQCGKVLQPLGKSCAFSKVKQNYHITRNSTPRKCIPSN